MRYQTEKSNGLLVACMIAGVSWISTSAAPLPAQQVELAAPEDGEPPSPPVRSVPARRTAKEKIPIHHLGATDSPPLPGQPWKIHDRYRPRPKAVQPGETPDAPPSDATILFDGQGLDAWCHHGEEDLWYVPMWLVEDDQLVVEPHTGSLYTIDSFGSCQLHLEWMIPEGTKGNSQGRGNSGIKFMELYEVQILDSFSNRTYADGQAGAIYGQYPPLVNAVKPQGQWQVYDIFFEAPKFEEEKLVRPAYLTVMLNGVLVQNHRQLAGPTGARAPVYRAGTPAAPIMLQDHGNRIRFRNIWVRELPEDVSHR